ncbi:transposase [Ramlibacter sp. AW1]|uniref:Transposase n=1 Tax=Ramlibacter aurantiacus TaxID=2801330 RepID=A0A936ZTL8_9BURK|nr:transposase [Ramlibacter aurantiacus]MBL0422321.1 transposase [Ramlibacter aurantiacus]
MARLSRLALAGHTHHVMQRALDPLVLFEDEADYRFMHQLLVEQGREQQVALHAYVLMPDRFHLLLTPASDEGLARLMQGLGRRYVRYRNARAARAGTLWEGRYRGAPLQPEAWLVPCMAFLDLAPVRAGLVELAADWAWSSHRHYVGLDNDRAVTPHALHWTLGNTPFAREHAYARRTQAGLSPAELSALVDSAQHGWPLGDASFRTALEQRSGRRTERGKPGRPRRAAPD